MELNLQEVRDTVARHAVLVKEINLLRNITVGSREPTRAHAYTQPANYQPLSKFLHMDLEEINVVINHAIQNPNELTRAALEHLVLVSKIQCSEEINQVRQKRKDRDAKYEAEMAKYQAGQVRIATATQKIKELQGAPQIKLKEVWLSVVDQLQQHCELHGHWVYTMSRKYQEYLSVLVRNSKYANYGEVGSIVVDWDQVRKFKSEHVRVVLEGILRVYDNNSALALPTQACSEGTAQ